MSKDENTIIIKKYANRRLYDTAKSCYVTLSDLADLIRKGNDFIVQDTVSGEDITHSILSQIIVEESHNGNNLLPTNFLRQIIRSYGDQIGTVNSKFFDSFFELLTAQRDRVNELSNTKNLHGVFDDVMNQGFSIFENNLRAFSLLTNKAKAGKSDNTNDKNNNPDEASDNIKVQAEEKARNNTTVATDGGVKIEEKSNITVADITAADDVTLPSHNNNEKESQKLHLEQKNIATPQKRVKRAKK